MPAGLLRRRPAWHLGCAMGAVLLVRYISTNQNNVFLDLSPDARVFGFTAALAVLTALLFGVLPALRSTRISLTAAMKDGLVEQTGRRAHFRSSSGKWIVGSQIAFSFSIAGGCWTISSQPG